MLDEQSESIFVQYGWISSASIKSETHDSLRLRVSTNAPLLFSRNITFRVFCDLFNTRCFLFVSGL